jgi:L-alanine-DL-glutamate epimerase-like enolase superfamily enzyme
MMEEFDVLFMEEPVGPDNVEAMAEVARSTTVRIHKIDSNFSC